MSDDAIMTPPAAQPPVSQRPMAPGPGSMEREERAAAHSAWTPDGETPPPVPAVVSETAVMDMIGTVFDPEIPVNIYELGLIYSVEIADDGKVAVEMTLTTPSCPSAQELPSQVEEAIRLVPGVTDVSVEVVWDPPWDPSRMSEDARLALNMY